MKISKRFACFLLCLVMIAGLLTTFGTAAFDISKSKEAAPTALDPDNDVTEITLSLPSAEYVDSFDIVFVSDVSVDTAALSASLETLMDTLINSGLNANIGVILFKGRAFDAMNVASGGTLSGLVPLTAENKDTFKLAASYDKNSAEVKANAKNGTNLPAGLELANQWLSASSTANDNQYVILLTNGRSYIWNDANGEPTTIYTQYTKNGSYDVSYFEASYNKGSEIPAVALVSEGDKYIANLHPLFSDAAMQAAFDAKVVSFADYASLYNVTDAQLLAELTTDVLDTPCLYTDYGTTTAACTVTKIPATNWGDFFKSDQNVPKNVYRVTDVTDGTSYLEYSPLKATFSEDGTECTYTFADDQFNDRCYMFHVSPQEKSLYIAGHLWEQMCASYHCMAVGSKVTRTAGYEVSKYFMDEWLPYHCEKFVSTETDPAAVTSLLNTLSNSMIYVVGKGAVTDEITPEFDLVMDGYGANTPFKLTLNGVEQTMTELSAVEWAFGTEDAGVYPYTVSWDSGTSAFTWVLNVAVKNAEPLSLKYRLKWKDAAYEASDVPTNGATDLTYWSSDNTGTMPTGTETFESPKVSFAIPTPPPPPPPAFTYTSLKVIMLWDDAGFEDSRPESVPVTLLRNGSEYNTKDLNEGNSWKHTWSALDDYYTWTLADVSVEGYTTTVDVSGTTYTVTNTRNAAEPSPEPSGTPSPDPSETPPADPGTEPTPPGPGPDETIDIGDGGVPMGKTDGTDAEEIDLGDGGTPLGGIYIADPNAPRGGAVQTGDSALMYLAGAVCAASALLGLRSSGKNRKK